METSNHNLKTNFRLWLQSELMERCRKNPRYSLRSFAAMLETEPSSISQIISGKRKASYKLITRICEKLSASPAQLDIFLSEVKTNKLRRSTASLSQENFNLIAEDTFAYLANWYHLAILELTFTQSFVNDPQWIANTLSISVTEAKMAIERMIRLGLLSLNEGVLTKTNKFVTNFTPGMTSGANKEYQRQLLQNALNAIDEIPQDEKDITSMTMAIDVDKLPEARKVITKFRRDMCAFLEDGEQTRVYTLGIQLYPVSHKNQESL